MSGKKVGLKQKTKKLLRGFRSIKLFQHYHSHLCHGRKVYVKLIEKYGADTRIFVNHYPGTGDVYITASLLHAWLRKEGVSKYVITVIGKSSLKVAKMFKHENVEILTKRDTEDLLHFLQTIGECEPNIEVLHFSPFAFSQRIMEQLLGVNGSDFIDMYMSIVFPGLSLDDMSAYDDRTSDQEIEEVFSKNGLIPGRTVVLAPYANTINLLNWPFWDYLADMLTGKGYTVCTNCDYPRERKVMGTIPIFLSYSQMKKFIETAGTIVQLRSGMGELLSGCNCKNYILYPIENYYRFGSVSLYDYFSLNHMGLSKNAIELEFPRNDEKKICERIVQDM